MGKCSVKFSKVYPFASYSGPQPVYVASFPWAASRACLVRKNGKVWETAPYVTPFYHARFSACPVGNASSTRHAAAMAFDYYYSREG